jgi:hypothetical protein
LDHLTDAVERGGTGDVLDGYVISSDVRDRFLELACIRVCPATGTIRDDVCEFAIGELSSAATVSAVTATVAAVTATVSAITATVAAAVATVVAAVTATASK